MKRNIVLIGVGCFVVGAIVLAGDDRPAPRRQIPIVVSAKVDSAAIREGDAIPLTITISNGLPGRIYHSTFSVTPTDWNGETIGVSLVDIYRDRPFNLYLSRPEAKCPDNISGMGSRAIEPGDSLAVKTDAKKWTLRDGWKRGHYTITVRVDNLRIDDYSKVSVLSDPFEFEIK